MKMQIYMLIAEICLHLLIRMVSKKIDSYGIKEK
jgi:hypothetical protein